MKVVIYGLSKSGTSALFYKICNSLGRGAIPLFEPSSWSRWQDLRLRFGLLRRGHLPIFVAKILLDTKEVRLQDFDNFDRKVLLVRDPRDRIVSQLLYRTFHAAFARDDKATEAFLKLLRSKEADPLSVSLLRLLRAFDDLEREAGADSAAMVEQSRDAMEKARCFHDARPGLPMFRYEQMVDGRFEELEASFGFSLGGAPTVPAALQRVVRTKGSGAWRDWFTPEDVEALRPLFSAYLERYYPSADWSLRSSPHVKPEHGSKYVVRVINERRGGWGVPPLPQST